MNDSLEIKKEGLTIFKKLLSGFILILILIGAENLYFIFQINRLSDFVERIYNHPLRVTRAVLSADANIVKIHRGMKDVALATTDAEIKSAVQLVNGYERKVHAQFEVVKKWILGEEGAKLQAETLQHFYDWKPIRDEVIALTRVGEKTKAYAITKGKGANHVELLNQHMERLKDYASGKASEMLDNARQTKIKIIKSIIVVFILLIVISGLFGYLLSQSFRNSIGELIKGVAEFGRGNLDYRVKVQAKDEISWLANAFNKMAFDHGIIVEELRKHKDQLEEMVKERTAALENEIKERKQIQEDLRKSEQMFREVIDSMEKAIAIYEPVDDGDDFKFVELNEVGEKIAHYKIEEIIGKTVKELFPVESMAGFVEKLKETHQTGKSTEIPLRQYKDGRITQWIESYIFKLPSGRVAAMFEDTLEQRQMEVQIKASLKEKEILLQEIHHRVKNNMQIIASLLSLQMYAQKSQDIKNVLRENIARVYAMSAIHESLYKSDSLVDINLQSYLERLSEMLFQTYSVNPANVTLQIRSNDVNLSINKANPLGLALNELISNALKYAFPGDRKGIISIELNQLTNGEIQLIIKDDGVGMPKDFDWGKINTMGLRLVKDLIEKQLKGKIHMDNHQGAKYTISFNLA